MTALRTFAEAVRLFMKFLNHLSIYLVFI